LKKYSSLDTVIYGIEPNVVIEYLLPGSCGVVCVICVEHELAD